MSGGFKHFQATESIKKNLSQKAHENNVLFKHGSCGSREWGTQEIPRAFQNTIGKPLNKLIFSICR